MYLLPQKSRSCTQSKSRDPRENSGGGDDPEEIPESAREPAGVELGREQTPREWRGADEPDEKAQVRSDVLYRRATELIELGDDGAFPCKGSCLLFAISYKN